MLLLAGYNTLLMFSMPAEAACSAGTQVGNEGGNAVLCVYLKVLLCLSEGLRVPIQVVISVCS